MHLLRPFDSRIENFEHHRCGRSVQEYCYFRLVVAWPSFKPWHLIHCKDWFSKVRLPSCYRISFSELLASVSRLEIARHQGDAELQGHSDLGTGSRLDLASRRCSGPSKVPCTYHSWPSF
jgi:hypothetical protein